MGDQTILEKILEMVEGLTKEVLDQKAQIADLTKMTRDQRKVISELRLELQSSVKVMKTIAEHTIGVSERLEKENVVDLMEEKLKTYTEVAKKSHMEFIQAKEEERKVAAEEHQNQQARVNNSKLSGLEEGEKENTKEIVASFFQRQLRVHEPQIFQAYRIGQRRGDHPRPIIVKFVGESEKARVMANRAMLKGERIWLDDDLTPTQVQARKGELEKVKAAKEQGLVAYLRNGQAIITQRKHNTK